MNKMSIVRRSIVGMVFTGACAYVVTFGVMAGFAEADAGARQVPSSNCHAAFDDNGSTVNNSGALTYTGAGTKSIFCPFVSDSNVGVGQTGISLNVYGTEGTNGAISRACICNVDPITCSCSTGKNWANNSGGVAGLVAGSVDTGVWGIAPAERFGYVLHTMTTNSSLAGMWMSKP